MKRNHDNISVVTRTYLNGAAADWWRNLTAEQRGVLIEHMLRNNRKLIDEVTWRKVD